MSDFDLAVISEEHNLDAIDFNAALADESELRGMYSAAEIERMRRERSSEAKAAAQRRASLDTSTGKVAVMVAGEAPWHRLGVNVSEAQKSEVAIRLASLDWTIGKVAMQTVDGAVVPGAFATVRQDTGGVLGVVGTHYQPFQNSEAFDFMDEVVGDGEAQYETAGAVNGGRTVWMLARLPNEVRVANTDDVTIPYILLSNSHDGKKALRILPTTNRVVCNNTLSLALGRAAKGGGFTLRHSASIKGRVAEARQKLGIVHRRVAQYQAKVNVLAGCTVTAAEVDAYLDQLFPVRVEKARNSVPVTELLPEVERLDVMLDMVVDATESARGMLSEDVYAERAAVRNRRIVDHIRRNLENERNTMPGIRGTAWALFNGVSEWADHQRTARGRNTLARLESRFVSNLMGPANDVKQEAFAAAMTLATSKA